MDFFSHLMIGILSGIFVLGDLPIQYLILAGIMVVIPDFDLLWDNYAMKKNLYYLTHRAASHSYIIGIIFSCIFSVFYSLIPSVNFYTSWLIGSLYYGVHVSIDILTTSKIPAFYPITKKEFKFAFERAMNPIMWIFSSLICLGFILLLLFRASLFSFRLYSVISSTLYGMYFLNRILVKILVSRHLDKTQRVIPGISLFSYLIYEKRDENSSINFKISFQKVWKNGTKIIFKEQMNKNSQEYLLFQNSFKISIEKFRFFSKWSALIPIVRINIDEIVVMLLLCESLSGNHCYFSKSIYKLPNNQLIKHFDGFEYRKNL